MPSLLKASAAALLVVAGFAVAWYFRQELQIACDRDGAGVPSCEVTEVRGWGQYRFSYPGGTLAAVRLERKENRDSDGSSYHTYHLVLTHRDGREWASHAQDKAETVVAGLNRFLGDEGEKVHRSFTSNTETQLGLAALFAIPVLGIFYPLHTRPLAALWAAVCLVLIVMYFTA